MDRAYETDKMVADLEGLITTFGTTVNVLVGHSMGSALCMYVAQRGFCARPAAIFLLGTAASLQSNPARHLLRCCDCLLECLRPLLSKAATKSLYHPSVDLLVAEKARVVSLQNPWYVIRAIALHLKWPDAEVQRGVRCPAVIIQGTADQVTPLAFCRPLLSTLRSVELVEVACAGHNVMLEAPEAVADNIIRFLAAIPGSASTRPTRRRPREI